MSGKLLRLACTAAVAAQAALAPVPADAAPQPQRSVSQLLTDLQTLYRQTEQATETYDATADRLQRQKAEVTRLDGELARARLALQDSRADAGRLARQQYQSASGLGPYISLLLAPDPQQMLDESHVIEELARQRARTVAKLTGAEQRKDAVARAARRALDTQQSLAGRQRRQRDTVQNKLHDVERLLAALSPDQLDAVTRLEQRGVDAAQKALTAAGSLPDDRPPSPGGERAVRFAMEQLGKPYVWGAQGPSAYDCSGLTSQAWQHAGTPIPRTSQEQWHRLKRVPLRRLRPGDLVIYFPEATHVAIYVGDGKVVQAPRPGARVKISPLASNPVLGAVRPG
ncbi:C40 family peptidase [Streptomyces sp. NEAU-sy36]|uniref:C40 family peptidase n=1 Tax=unclassified Streptomyces TaxID=2593676 RepID=UPI0015D6076F|nr:MULTISPECIES: C40 family peptidase [unclassified Streptomyces]QLJ04968.1 C40 family peptidase [Streptomyces sp. NEAU-sy36]